MILSGTCICTVDNRFRVNDTKVTFKASAGSVLYLDVSGYTNLSSIKRALDTYVKCSDIIVINANIPEYAVYLTSILTYGDLSKLGVNRLNVLSGELKSLTFDKFNEKLELTSNAILRYTALKDGYNITYEIADDLLADNFTSALSKTYRANRGGMGASFLVLLSNFIACSDYLTDDLRRKLRNTLIKLRVTLLKCNRVEK